MRRFYWKEMLMNVELKYLNDGIIIAKNYLNVFQMVLHHLMQSRSKSSLLD